MKNLKLTVEKLTMPTKLSEVSAKYHAEVIKKCAEAFQKNKLIAINPYCGKIECTLLDQNEKSAYESGQGVLQFVNPVMLAATLPPISTRKKFSIDEVIALSIASIAFIYLTYQIFT